MLHKRCDIRDLIDGKIVEQTQVRDNATDDDEAYEANIKVITLQEVRVGIFDEPYSG